MSGSQSPWIYRATADVGAVHLHPFDGLPLQIIDQLYPLSGEPTPAGTGGRIGYFNHFFGWEGPLSEGAASGWALSGVTGAATIALNNLRNGEIVLTADATANCDPTLQYGSTSLGARFVYSVGKRIWCFTRCKLSTVTSMEFFFGIATPDTEPTVTNTLPSDGIFFEKADSATNMDFHARQDGTSTERTAMLPSVLVNDTYVTIGFCVDALGNIVPYHNGTALVSKAIAVGDANIPNAAADVMQFITGFRGASQAVTYDWILFYQEI